MRFRQGLHGLSARLGYLPFSFPSDQQGRGRRTIGHGFFRGLSSPFLLAVEMGGGGGWAFFSFFQFWGRVFLLSLLRTTTLPSTNGEVDGLPPKGAPALLFPLEERKQRERGKCATLPSSAPLISFPPRWEVSCRKERKCHMTPLTLPATFPPFFLRPRPATRN